MEPFLAEGFILSDNVVLTADDASPPPHPNTDVQIRPLRSDADWIQVVDNQVACHATEFPGPEYRVFKQRQMDGYRRMTRAGPGAWLGAFVDGRLVADLGVFAEMASHGSRPWRRTRTFAAAASAARWCTRAPRTHAPHWVPGGW